MKKIICTSLLLVVAFLVGVPSVMIVTYMLSPLWWWIERAQGIEAMGHSGPAGWCFRLILGLYIVVWGIGILLVRRRIRSRQPALPPR